MSDFIPKAEKGKVGGLSRAAQRLQSAREKAALAKGGSKAAAAGTSTAALKMKDSFANTKKTSFTRKAV